MRRLQALLFGLALALGAPAAAQNPYAPALLVNDGVITNYDIVQRMNLLDALGATGDVRGLAVQQLTEDRIKVQAARDAGLDLDEAALEAGIEEFAQQRGITTADVDRVLAARGIDRQTLEDFVEAGLVWREIVTARFRGRAMPTEADLDAALGLAASRAVEVVQLAELAIPFAEHGDAGATALAERLTRELRAGADFGAAVRRYSRSDSAVRGGILPSVPASQLPPAIRGQILLMEPGDVTEPLPIAGGLAILRLVSVRLEPAAAGEAGIPAPENREALREELFVQRITSFGQGYLQELMGDALIVEP